MATRTDQLAQPKPNLLRFPDKRSVYWLDKLPTKQSGTVTNFELSPRWSKLTEGKQIHFNFERGSRSPEWRVSAAALKANPSGRVCFLALPRLPAAGWQPDRPLLATLNTAVQTAVASPRICELAQPKQRFPPTPSDQPENGMRPTSVSSRIRLLAAPKSDHPQYLLDRPVTWPLSAAVRKAVASEHLQELAQPKPRRGLFEGFNPYTVSPAARAATASLASRSSAFPSLANADEDR